MENSGELTERTNGKSGSLFQAIAGTRKWKVEPSSIFSSLQTDFLQRKSEKKRRNATTGSPALVVYTGGPESAAIFCFFLRALRASLTTCNSSKSVTTNSSDTLHYQPGSQPMIRPSAIGEPAVSLHLPTESTSPDRFSFVLEHPSSLLSCAHSPCLGLWFCASTPNC